jgi:hypothetical protein
MGRPYATLANPWIRSNPYSHPAIKEEAIALPKVIAGLVCPDGGKAV